MTTGQTARSPLWILIAAGIVLGLGMGVRQTYGLFIEPINADLGVSVASISLAIAIQNLLWGVVTPFCGAIADRYGTGRVLVVGGLFYAGGLVLTAFAQGPVAVFAGTGLLVGLGVSAASFPLVLSVVARSAPDDRRNTWLGLASAGGSVGQFLLLPGAQGLIAAFGWVNALLVLAALAFLIVPLAASLSMKPGTTQGGAQSLSTALEEARGHGGYWLLTAGFFVCGFHVSFIATHLPSYIVSCNLPAFVGATALGLIGFFNIIGGLMAGWLGQRFRVKYLLAGIYLARAAAITVFVLAPKVDVVVWAFSATFGLLWLSTVPLTSALVGQIFGPRYMATLFGIVMLGHQVGAFFGAWLGGLSFDMTGSYDTVWWIAILLGLLAAALHWPIEDKTIQRPATEAAS